jgi:hypothetical protein
VFQNSKKKLYGYYLLISDCNKSNRKKSLVHICHFAYKHTLIHYEIFAVVVQMCYCFNNAETVETKINFVMSLVTVHIQSNVVMSKLSKYKLML